MRRTWTVRTALGAYALLLAAGSLLPSGSEAIGGWEPPISATLQNLLHVPAYLGLSFLTLSALGPTAGWPSIALAALAAVAYGGALEWLQATVIPGRFGTVMDLLFNTAGVLAGLGLWSLRRPRAAADAKA